VQNELAVWRTAFAAPETTGTSHADNAATDIVGLRARVNPLGKFLIEIRPDPDKPWRPPTQRWFNALAASRPADFSDRPPAEALPAGGASLPAVVDASKVDPRTFLQRIVQPPRRAPVADGVTLPPLSVTFVCYE
jgi:hypothetical protein